MYVSVGGLFSKIRSEKQQEHAWAVFCFFFFSSILEFSWERGISALGSKLCLSL